MSSGHADRLSSEALAYALRVDLSPSSFVSVDQTKLEALSRHLRRRIGSAEYRSEQWNDPALYAVDRSEVERSQFFAIGNAINFRYWDKVGGQVVRAKGVKRGREFAGAMYMWRCLQ